MEYHLFSSAREPEIVKPAKPTSRQQRKKQRSSTTKPVYHWSREVPLYVRAMVLTRCPDLRRETQGQADKTLFMAGPLDIIDEEEVFSRPDARGLGEKLREQTAALEGRKGALLWVVSASDGKKLAQYNLESVPVWDGMAAANGRLYLSMKNGRVLCFGGR
ncbi:hypothetical protein ES703_90884 [subsurface metagenome]